MSHKRWLPSLVFLVATVIVTVAPSSLDILQLPSCEFKAGAPERLVDISNGQYKFVNYKVIKSNTIAGSRVWGNVAFWFGASYQLPYVRLLTEADYRRTSPMDIENLNVATFRDACTRCSWNQTHFAWKVAFNFTSHEATATSYYFLFQIGLSGAKNVTVDILSEECVTPLWRMPLVWGIAWVAVTVIAFIYNPHRWDL